MKNSRKDLLLPISNQIYVPTATTTTTMRTHSGQAAARIRLCIIQFGMCFLPLQSLLIFFIFPWHFVVGCLWCFYFYYVFGNLNQTHGHFTTKNRETRRATRTHPTTVISLIELGQNPSPAGETPPCARETKANERLGRSCMYEPGLAGDSRSGSLSNKTVRILLGAKREATSYSWPGGNYHSSQSNNNPANRSVLPFTPATRCCCC